MPVLFFPYQNLENELNSHDALTKALISTGQKRVREGGHSASTVTMEQVKELEGALENLKVEALERRKRLKQSYEAQHLLTEVNWSSKAAWFNFYTAEGSQFASDLSVASD